MSPEHEGLIAFAFYAPIALVIVLEALAPRRAPTRPTVVRWVHAGGLALINASLGWLAASMSPLLVATGR